MDEALEDDEGREEADEFVPSALIVIFDPTSHAVVVVGALHAPDRLELTPCLRLLRDLDLQDQRRDHGPDTPNAPAAPEGLHAHRNQQLHALERRFPPSNHSAPIAL